MGHHISAVVLKGHYSKKMAETFDLKPLRLTDELTLFPLSAAYIDSWAERLGVSGSVDDVPLLNFQVVHHMINKIAAEPLFALIETDYFGGLGSKSAAVYRGATEVMQPQVGDRPINKALRLLGVKAGEGRDEFDTVGLGKYRDFFDLFEAYQDN